MTEVRVSTRREFNEDARTLLDQSIRNIKIIASTNERFKKDWNKSFLNAAKIKRLKTVVDKIEKIKKDIF